MKPTIGDVVRAKVTTSTNESTSTAVSADESSEDIFTQPQNRRGFLGNQNSNQRSTYKNRRETITGARDNTEFAAPVDLYMSNVDTNITPEKIQSFMKDHKDITILECVKISHNDARIHSFRVKVNAAEYQKAMLPKS